MRNSESLIDGIKSVIIKHDIEDIRETKEYKNSVKLLGRESLTFRTLKQIT